jgi:SagB-type dehydrogenase family enzyme
MVSPAASVTWREGALEIGVPGAAMRLRTDDVEVLRVVHAFASPRTVSEVVRELAGRGRSHPEHILECVSELCEAKVLVRDGDLPVSGAEEVWDAETWAFHCRSRGAGRRELRSGTGIAPDRELGRRVTLPHPSTSDETLAVVLGTRRSSRAWSDVALEPVELSTVLWHAARERAPFDSTRAPGSRPYPSGGGAYSLEIYVVVLAGAVRGVDRGVHRYRPANHDLVIVSDRGEDTTAFLEAAAQSAAGVAPPVLLLVTTEFARQARQYDPALAYSLVLKEVGGLFQTLYLLAAALDLAACALGGGLADDQLATVLGEAGRGQVIVGEFALGPAPGPDPRGRTPR